jgi:hypothetical protein
MSTALVLKLLFLSTVFMFFAWAHRGFVNDSAVSEERRKHGEYYTDTMVFEVLGFIAIVLFITALGGSMIV